jgi:hypothetical protein
MKRLGGLLLAVLLPAAAGAAPPAEKGVQSVSEWLPIADWGRCAELARQGVVFEIRNRDGLSLFAECAEAVPAAPWDWTSPPVEFRAVIEPPAERSTPIPAPAQ